MINLRRSITAAITLVLCLAGSGPMGFAVASSLQASPLQASSSLPLLLPAVSLAQPQPHQPQQQPPAAIQEIARLFQQGADALSKRDYARAEESFLAAAERGRAIRDAYSVGAALDALGTVYAAKGNTREALRVQVEAIGYLRESGHKEGLARALQNTGVSYEAAGRMDEAIASLEEAVRIWRELGSLPAYSATLMPLGHLHRKAGHFAKADAVLQEALRLRQQSNAGPREIAGCFNDLGLLYHDWGRFKEARQYYDRALQIAQGTNNPDQYASVINNRGVLDRDQGRYKDAFAAHQQTLQIREQGSDPDAVASALLNLAGDAFYMSRYDLSLFYGRRALSIVQKTGTKPLMATLHSNIGVTQNAMGQRRKALESYLRSLALHEEIGNNEAAAGVLFNLGMLHSSIGDYGAAARLLGQALPLAERRGDSKWTAQILSSLAIVKAETGQPEEALTLFSRSHDLLQKTGSPDEIARSFNSLGTYYARLKRTDEAIAAYTRSLALKSKLGDKQLTAVTQSNLASVYSETAQYDKSAALLQEAVANVEAVRDHIAAPSEIGALQNRSLGDVYARYASVLLHQNRPDDALVQVERGRGQGLARQAAQQSRTEWTGVLPVAAARRLNAATNVLRQADASARSAEQRADTLALVGDDESVREAERAADEARRERAEAQLALSAIRDELARRYPAYRTYCGLDAPTMETFTALSKAHPDTLFLTWATDGVSETLLFAFRAEGSSSSGSDGGVQAFRIPVGGSALSKQVRAWRSRVILTDQESGELVTSGSDAAKTEEQLARALYDTLFGPVEKAGLLSAPQVKRLVVIGDGPLRELPFAALVDGSGKRLIERFPLSTGVSLRLLAKPAVAPPTAGGVPGAVVEEAVPSAPAGRGFLCIADPGGGGGGGVAAVAAGQADSILLEGFAPLPAARREGIALGQLFGDGATVLVGNNATREAIQQRMTTARLLHFATHGLLDDKNGLRSGLLIAPSKPSAATGGKEAEEEDALESLDTEMPLLTAEEILAQPLAAELVTLSACETGRGERGGGEGLLGLVWAFRAAGCPSIVASQWSVDDDATGRLMVRFYEGLKAGKRRDDALREAMLFVRGTGADAAAGKTFHPFFWAAFQLHGDAGPLENR